MHTLPFRSTFDTAAARRALVVVLVVAMVLAQALGLMHRALHGGGQAPVAASAASSAVAAQVASEPGAHSHGWMGALFAGHASDADCRLYDPLNHDGPATVAVLQLPLLLTSFFLAIAAGDFVARWAALFDARGPPASR